MLLTQPLQPLHDAVTAVTTVTVVTMVEWRLHAKERGQVVALLLVALGSSLRHLLDVDDRGRVAAGALLDLLRVATAEDDRHVAAIDLLDDANAQHVVFDLVARVDALPLTTSRRARLHPVGRVRRVVATVEDPGEDRGHCGVGSEGVVTRGLRRAHGSGIGRHGRVFLLQTCNV